ncbi:MAG: NUDIX domain-containing protein [Novosphingobium sp.]
MSGAPSRRIRRAARIVLLDGEDRVLLFRYVPANYPLFWIMPGGACDPDEDFPTAARRELLEETGIIAEPHPLDLVREAEYDYLGEPVTSVEHFFLHRAMQARIDTSGHTELEREVMQVHRWFTRAEIEAWPETIYPLDIIALMDRALRMEGRRHRSLGLP